MQRSRIKDSVVLKFSACTDFLGPEDCWMWGGNLDSYGYGVVGLGFVRGRRRRIKAHRLSWMIYKGKLDPKLFVCHSCDNPGCVNPSHLFVGTHIDNMRDRDAKGRQSRGARHPCSVLSDGKVREIWHLRAEGLRHRDIGALMGISPEQVSSILTGRAWTHVRVSEKIKQKAANTANAAGKGKRHGYARLCDDDVLHIFNAYAGGLSPKEIGGAFSVGEGAIYSVLYRKTWKHVAVPASLVAAAKACAKKRMEKGRPSRSARKWTEKNVCQVVELRSAGVPVKEIADKFGVHVGSIYHVFNYYSRHAQL